MVTHFTAARGGQRNVAKQHEMKYKILSALLALAFLGATAPAQETLAMQTTTANTIEDHEQVSSGRKPQRRATGLALDLICLTNCPSPVPYRGFLHEQGFMRR